MYGIGVLKLNERTQKVERVGGLRWIIKDGIVYDSHALLADARARVRAGKEAAGLDPTVPMTVKE